MSLRYAVIKPKSGSSGACGTLSAVKTEGAGPAMCPLMLESLVRCADISDVSDEVGGAGFEGDIVRNEVGGDKRTASECDGWD